MCEGHIIVSRSNHTINVISNTEGITSSDVKVIQYQGHITPSRSNQTLKVISHPQGQIPPSRSNPTIKAISHNQDHTSPRSSTTIKVISPPGHLPILSAVQWPSLTYLHICLRWCRWLFHYRAHWDHTDTTSPHPYTDDSSHSVDTGTHTCLKRNITL